ncbi:MAG: Sak single strand annealing protein [Candidatus Thorarchaeota archaeon]
MANAKKKSVFETLNAINVNGRTETKNGLTYLSWAWAWATAKENYPEATYTIYEDADGVFYHRDHNSAWVKTGVTIEGIEHIEYLPVMDFRNNSIDLVKIKSTDVNKAIQRSLTKALARHGLGLYVYAGEDLPSSEKEQPKVESKKTTTVEVKGIPDDKMMDMLKYVAENKELGLKQLVANIEQKYHVTKTQEKEIAKVLKSK